MATLASFEVAGSLLVFVGFALLYLGVGLMFTVLTFDMKLGFEKRLYLMVTWPNYLSSRQSIEERQKAREIEAATAGADARDPDQTPWVLTRSNGRCAGASCPSACSTAAAPTGASCWPAARSTAGGNTECRRCKN